jgi:hypothetical protein
MLALRELESETGADEDGHGAIESTPAVRSGSRSTTLAARAQGNQRAQLTLQSDQRSFSEQY